MKTCSKFKEHVSFNVELPIEDLMFIVIVKVKLLLRTALKPVNLISQQTQMTWKVIVKQERLSLLQTALNPAIPISQQILMI